MLVCNLVHCDLFQSFIGLIGLDQAENFLKRFQMDWIDRKVGSYGDAGSIFDGSYIGRGATLLAPGSILNLIWIDPTSAKDGLSGDLGSS